MSRKAILIIAACLALVAGLLPLGVMGYVSRQRAIAAEEEHLDEYARWTLQRAGLTLSSAKAALNRAAGWGLKGCSTEHIARMRQLVVEDRFIEEMGYYDGARLGCTSWGMAPAGIPRGHARQNLPGGFGLYLGVRPKVSRAEKLIVLDRGDYNVLINPARMTDVLVDARMTLGLATADGKLISLTGPVDPALLDEISGHIGVGLNDSHVFASARGTGGAAGLIAFAVADRGVVQKRLDRELMILAPLAILVSLVLVGVVIWVSRQRLSPQSELDEAIRRREFVAHYQPIIELSTGRCVGAEALARWRRPDGVQVSPDQFIPLAEQFGSLPALTDLLIEQVVTDLEGMFYGDKAVHVAINLSAADIESGRFLPVLQKALEGSHVLPSQIWLEATERGFINADAARETIETARRRGHTVAIDDFGTGYSSLSMLETLPLDALKIDKSFIAAIGRDTATSVVTPHIIEMAHGLRFNIVAEGVETLEQEAQVRAAGVQYAQGWLYAKALPPEEFSAFFWARNAEPVGSA